MQLTTTSTEFLLELARLAIRRGLDTAGAGAPDIAGAPAEVLVQRASFVTLLTASGELRGCRGALEAHQPLAADVWHNAWASAFDDPRFAPVSGAEVAQLQLEISVLGPLEALPVQSEAQLLAILVPGRDGVAIAWRGRRATFLPQVWEILPDPPKFLAHLKQKAGLSADFWAGDLQVQRYRVAKLRAPQRAGSSA